MLPSVVVRRSGLNTSRRKGARTGHMTPIVRAGDGLFVTRDYRPGEHILDYRFVNGQSGARVDWITRAEFRARYPPTAGMPYGAGTHALSPWTSPYVYDTARTGGVGGKVNTRPGKQTAFFRGTQLYAHRQRGLKQGVEVFASYSNGKAYQFGGPSASEARHGWSFIGGAARRSRAR